LKLLVDNFAPGWQGFVLAPSGGSVTRRGVSMVLGASGAASSVETVQLFTMEEAMTAMTKAGQVQKSYKPPTAI